MLTANLSAPSYPVRSLLRSPGRGESPISDYVISPFRTRRRYDGLRALKKDEAMIELLPTDSPKIVSVRISGKLHDEDYKTFVPAVEAIVAAEGKIRLFAQFVAFQGWDLQAAWDDFKFGVKHYHDIERIAIVGDKKWEKWMATFCKPFTQASVKYFDAPEVEAAWSWLRAENV
jgi:hypothetical protein